MRRAQVSLALFVFLLVTPVATGLFTTIGWDTVFGALGIALSGLIIAAMVVRGWYRMRSEQERSDRQRRDSKRSQATEQSDGEGEGFWSAIPNRQYNGRFAEAGGLTRSEQSDAIEKVQTNAEEIKKNQR